MSLEVTRSRTHEDGGKALTPNGDQTGEIRNYPAGTSGVCHGMARTTRVFTNPSLAEKPSTSTWRRGPYLQVSSVPASLSDDAMVSAISASVLGVLLLLIRSCRGQEARCFLAVLARQCICVTSSCTTISPRCALLFAPSFYIMLHHSMYEYLRFCTWLLVSMGPT